MRDFVKNTSIIGGTEILLTLVSFTRNKYLAVNIGPAGFGIYGLLSSFFNLLSVFTGTWLAKGTIKYASEYNKENDSENVNHIITFTVALTLCAAVVITLICFAFGSPIKSIFLSPQIAQSYFILFAASFVGASLGTILTSLLQGLLLIKKIAVARAVTSLIDLLFILFFVHFFELEGFFISILLSSAVTAVFLWRSLPKVEFRRAWLTDFRNVLTQKILRFGSVNLFLTLVDLLSQYLQRIIVLAGMGISAVGLFQAANSLKNYLGIPNRGSTFVLFPKMSERIGNDERNRIFDEYLRLTLFIGVPTTVVTNLFIGNLVKILFATSFAPLANFFYLFAIAQLIISVEYAFQSIVIGMELLTVHSVATVVTHLFWVFVPLFGLSTLGIGSVGWGFIAASIASICIQYFYLRSKVTLKFSRDLLILFLFGTISVAFSVVGHDYPLMFKILIVLGTFPLLSLGIKKHEWGLLRKLVLR
jgi:antigen flippase